MEVVYHGGQRGSIAEEIKEVIQMRKLRRPSQRGTSEGSPTEQAKEIVMIKKLNKQSFLESQRGIPTQEVGEIGSRAPSRCLLHAQVGMPGVGPQKYPSNSQVITKALYGENIS